MTDLNLKIKINADLQDSIKNFASLKKSVVETEKQFKQAQDKVKGLAQQLKESGNSSVKLSKEFERAKAQAAQLKKSLASQNIELNKNGLALAEAGINTADLSKAWRQLKADLNAGQAALNQSRQAAGALGQLNIRPFKDIQADISGIEKAYTDLKNSGVASQAELNRAHLVSRQRVRELKDEMNGFGTELRNVYGEVIAVVAAFAGIAAGAKEISRVGVQFQSFQNSLKSVLGSQEAAADAMQFLRAESERLGTSLESNIPAFVKLAASAQGTALQGQGVRDIFTAISEAGAALGLSGAEVEGALTAVSQIMSKGKVSAEELRGQLGERLPGAFNIAARAIGVSTQELDRMLTAGELLADDFLPKFARQLSAENANGVASASQSAAAAFNRLNNSLFELKVALAEGGVVDALAAIAELLTTLANGFQGLNPFTKSFIALLASLGTATVIWRLSLKSVVSALTDALIPAMAGATVSAKALSLAMKGLGVVGIALTVFEIGRALYDYATGAEQATESTNNLNKAQQKLKETETKLQSELDGLNQKRAALEKELTEATLAESKKRTEQQISDNKRVVSDLERDIEQSKRLQKDLADEIAGRQRSIQRIQEDSADKLRRLQREGLAESQKQADIQLQISEELTKARNAAANDPQEAARLAQKAEQLAGELNDRQKLAAVIRESSQIQIQAEQNAIALAEQRKDAEAQRQAELEAQVEREKANLDELINKRDELNKPVTLEIQTNLDEVNAKVSDLQARLKDLRGNIEAASTTPDISGNRLNAFASGGPVTGPGTSTSDSILARLSHGEYVVKAAAVQRYGMGFIDSINRMQLPKFSEGGPVGAGNQINITLPGGQTFGPFNDSAGQAFDLELALRRESMKRGRRL